MASTILLLIGTIRRPPQHGSSCYFSVIYLLLSTWYIFCWILWVRFLRISSPLFVPLFCCFVRLPLLFSTFFRFDFDFRSVTPLMISPFFFSYLFCGPFFVPTSICCTRIVHVYFWTCFCFSNKKEHTQLATYIACCRRTSSTAQHSSAISHAQSSEARTCRSQCDNAVKQTIGGSQRVVEHLQLTVQLTVSSKPSKIVLCLSHAM